MPVLSVYVSEETLARLQRIARVDSGSRSVEGLAEDAIENEADKDPRGDEH